MTFYAFLSSNDELDYLPSQQQVQDVLVQGGIPAKFVQPLDSTLDESAKAEDSTEASDQSVPLIDIGSLLQSDDESLLSSAQAKEIERVCREWGIFQVVNHGISPELIQRMSDLQLQYFQSPLEARDMDLLNIPHPSSGLRDWNDAMIHYVKPSIPDVVRRRTLPQGYKEALNEYVEEVLKLSKTMRRVLSSGLGLNPSHIEDVLGDAGAVARVNYYPVCPQPELVSGISAHSDIGVMTVLHQNQVEGLQVLKDGRWFTVPAIKNALTVNVSDILQVMSNDAYVSCLHRAMVNPHSARLTTAVFVTMPGDRPFGPLPELLDAEHPPLYKHSTPKEYMQVVKSSGLRGKLNLETLRIPDASAAPSVPVVARNENNIEPFTASGNAFVPKLVAIKA